MSKAMKVHDLKCWPEYFREVRCGSKTFEWRYNGDRKFKTGDVILQREYNIRTGKFSGEVEIHGAGYIIVVGDHDIIALVPATPEQFSAAFRHEDKRKRGAKR